MIPDMRGAAVWLDGDHENRKIEVSADGYSFWANALDNGRVKGEGKGPTLLHAIAEAGDFAWERE